MIDSSNVRVLADNIQKLWDKLKSISGDLLPSRSTATTGQILQLTGENKIPAWVDNSGGSFLSLLTAQPVIQTKAKEDDPSHDYILIKIGDGEFVEYRYNELPDLSQYGIAISYSSPSWKIKCFNFFMIDGTAYIFYGDEITWQYQQDEGYVHTITGYNIPSNEEPEIKKTTKKKTTK